MSPEGGLWHNIRRTFEGLLVGTLILGSTIGTVYNTTDNHNDDRAVIELKTQNRRDDDRISALERQFAAIEHDHQHYEPGPVGPCMCVGKTADGKDVEIRQCRVVPECDQRAIKACEAYYPGFKCKNPI